MSTENKYFTVEEANAVIPQLLIDIPRLQMLMDDLTHKYPDVEKAREKAQFNGGSLQGADYINCVFKYILNCILKGLESLDVKLWKVPASPNVCTFWSLVAFGCM